MGKAQPCAMFVGFLGGSEHKEAAGFVHSSAVCFLLGKLQNEGCGMHPKRWQCSAISCWHCNG